MTLPAKGCSIDPVVEGRSVAVDKRNFDGKEDRRKLCKILDAANARHGKEMPSLVEALQNVL